MKKAIPTTVVLVVFMAGLAFAQITVSKERLLNNRQGLALEVSKAGFGLGEPVEFILRSTRGPFPLQLCSYIIEKQLPNGKWAEFYRSGNNPLGQAVLARGAEHKFTWNQSDTSGAGSANPGSWRIVFSPVQGIDKANFILNFNIQNTPAGPPALTLKAMNSEFVRGENGIFRLQNVSNSAVDLTGCSFAIEHFENDKWVEFYASRVEPWDIRSLAPGEIHKWFWGTRDRSGRLADPGLYRCVFNAPRVAGSPFIFEVNVR